jgi:hypothetical protein
VGGLQGASGVITVQKTAEDEELDVTGKVYCTGIVFTKLLSPER